MSLFEVKEIDREIYNSKIKEYLPARIIDAHSHVWLKDFKLPDGAKQRATAWSALIAEDSPIEELIETYNLLFEGKEVIPVIFGKPATNYDLGKCNKYVEKTGKENNFPTLFLSSPYMDEEEFEKSIIDGGHKGSKVYLNFSPSYIPGNEIRIFDFLPHHQLKVLDRHGWICMLHIPRPGRLKDPVNIAQLLEIEEKYKNIKLIVAHVGRAYAEEDMGDAFEKLGKTENMLFDISANVNSTVFVKLIETVGPKRILFGTDFPVFRMRGKRIVENGVYYNLIPKGLYGDVSGEKHMREVEEAISNTFTFMIYEEILAFKDASEKTGLTKNDIEDVFFNNAARIFNIK
ncbi:MAG TPA: amidohydrolase family protein [Clostridiaceae bacterium]|nr:amidohydrolase family protein [Clostridiaceae bacterium]